MFGFKKNKKQNNIYTESYVVKDVDNIISIAQSYGIPWKELASVNEIKPPYILISGETINVPGEDVDVADDVTKEAQVSDVMESEHSTKQANNTNSVQTQMQHQVNMTKGSVKKSLDTVTKAPASKMIEKSTQKEQVVSNKNPKTRKVTYAAPKDMLQKPSAEPTTRAIDIEWMQDDEAVYSEEIQSQRKKLNTQFIIITILVIVIVGLITWWSVTWFLGQNNNEDVSVQTLIEEEVETDENKEITINEDADAQAEENKTTKEVEDANETEKQVDDNDNNEDNEQDEVDVPVEEITIQVLNAGAQVGSAGDVTEVFATKGYKTVAAKNSSNDYNNVVIYYSSDKKDGLDAVSKEISEKYGTRKHEESDEVTKKYNADFVVVLGS